MSLLEEVRRISSEHSFLAKKGLGQNFLIDERVLEREVRHAAVDGKTVLEIGPGFGFLTKKLAAKAERIVAIEKDARLLPILRGELAGLGNVELVHADFLRWKAKEKFDVIISNIPYSISSPLLFRLAEMDFGRAVLCLQKEFVDRLLAKPGTKDYSRLSVTSQARFRIRLLERVSRSAFHPRPKVDSALIELVPTGRRLSPLEEKLVLLLFQHRKKTVRAALADSASQLGVAKEEAQRAAAAVGLAERRVFTLTEKEFSSIASALPKPSASAPSRVP